MGSTYAGFYSASNNATLAFDSPMREESSSSSWSDQTLKQIDEVSNEMDIDFQVSNSASTSSQPPSIYVILDTNILLGYLKVVQIFVEDVKRNGQPIAVIIPGIVIQELDYQKTDKSRHLCWPARVASTWILSQLREKRVVKGQAYQETLQQSGSWKKRDPHTSNDDLIVDCCLFFQKNKRKQVFAISKDHNFCNTAESQGIVTIDPADFKQWSSKTLAKSVLRESIPPETLNKFSTFKEVFQPKQVRDALDAEMGPQPPMPSIVEDDRMEVDDEFTILLDPPPQHLLDDLHNQILEHFTILLSELLRRVAPALFEQPVTSKTGAAASKHAPSIVSRPAREWKARDYLLYLCNIRHFPSTSTAANKDRKMVRDGSSRLVDFFTERYDPKGKGRSGQHWSRADWMLCLSTLRALGQVYNDPSIMNSLIQLDPQVALVFQTPMRPTGTGGF